MRILTLICAVILTNSIFAQSDTLLSFSKIQDADTLKASTLFLRAQLWINDNFKSGKDVTQLSDKENGVLTGRGIIKLAYIYNYYTVKKGETPFTFSIKIFVKDGRYKYEFWNFENIDSFEGDVEHRIGKLSSATECPIRWKGWSKRVPNEIWESTKASLSSKIGDLELSLKSAMTAKKEPNDF